MQPTVLILHNILYVCKKWSFHGLWRCCFVSYFVSDITPVEFLILALNSDSYCISGCIAFISCCFKPFFFFSSGRLFEELWWLLFHEFAINGIWSFKKDSKKAMRIVHHFPGLLKPLDSWEWDTYWNLRHYSLQTFPSALVFMREGVMSDMCINCSFELNLSSVYPVHKPSCTV